LEPSRNFVCGSFMAEIHWYDSPVAPESERVAHKLWIQEELDLNSLAREAAQHAFPRQPRNVKPLVAVIVKLPCLAVRYPSRTEQVHAAFLTQCSPVH
jgi:hypothetical protein